MMRRPVSSDSVAASTPPAAPDPMMRMSHWSRMSVGARPDQGSRIADRPPDGIHGIRGNHHDRPRRRMELATQDEAARVPQLEVLALAGQRLLREAAGPESIVSERVEQP